jgi:hypothetical protein
MNIAQLKGSEGREVVSRRRATRISGADEAGGASALFSQEALNG